MNFFGANSSRIDATIVVVVINDAVVFVAVVAANPKETSCCF
jgi:hypothetical protein